jgi:excisionase family DNA binding protein
MESRTMAKSKSDSLPGTRTLLSVNEVAARWNLSPLSVYRMIWAGRLPSVRVGLRLIRVRLADVLAHEEGHG